MGMGMELEMGAKMVFEYLSICIRKRFLPSRGCSGASASAVLTDLVCSANATQGSRYRGPATARETLAPGFVQRG
jgi:hypothetical protein